ncbi:GNAT family protein [Pseudomonas syringae pv. tagetis]|uniref:GCN5-related N-acetyltransferase n=1 Tax=Pseudomonas syringae pv. tagetis TaxID=129140 RepID=A0A0Q0BVM1_9PSED|nr:GNAT family protein [Pseudomonas syringae group genomosp. 7]KPY82399.1 GCN5-related N-acetyltransferase [Pseudomonas syringae pv. tagetis]RMW17827.1 GCN5-related N-acetyltransferase [Pseudomonas syringae pv. tagetis]RMW20642.1 GCN5-related N-acetyltransferase [Pseudomonas syringae pv. tagetis]UNB71040.1 GNAT family N-acetyltransferase [Pseudomonas syringae pv. tagetis]
MKESNLLPAEIQTERLLIRVAKPGDGIVFNQAVTESAAHLKKWLAWTTPTPSIEQSELSCRHAYARFLMNEDLMAFLFLKTNGALVGGSGLHYVNWTLRSFEVGYWGRTQYLGKGLIREGVAALVSYAIEHLLARRVFLTMDERNLASRRLAERVGFEYEGTLRQDRTSVEGGLRNTRIYSVIGT